MSTTDGHQFNERKGGSLHCAPRLALAANRKAGIRRRTTPAQSSTGQWTSLSESASQPCEGHLPRVLLAASNAKRCRPTVRVAATAASALRCSTAHAAAGGYGAQAMMALTSAVPADGSKVYTDVSRTARVGCFVRARPSVPTLRQTRLTAVPA